MESNIDFWGDDLLLVRLAREIAMDHYELEEILRRYGINAQQWERISKDEYFNRVLQNEIVTWNETTNTHERSKLKASAVIEEWLPEAHVMLHARGESLAAKVGLAQLLTKIAGMGAGVMNVEGGGGGEKFVININLGEQNGMQREIRLEKVINAELGVTDVEEEQVQRAIPAGMSELERRAASGGGVKVASEFDKALNPSELVKKWSV